VPSETSLEMIDKVDRGIWLPAGITRRDMPIYRSTSCHSKLDLSGLNHLRHDIAAKKSDTYSYQKHPTVQV